MFLPFIRSAIGALYRERIYDRPRWNTFSDRRLAAILAHASRVPFYADRLRGIDLARPREALALVRPVTKEELMGRFDETIAGGGATRGEVEAFTKDPSTAGTFLHGDLMVATTSGTTGRVGWFVTDAVAWAEMNGALFARILRHRLVPREIIRFCFGRRYRMAMAVVTGGHYVSSLVGTFKPSISRLLVDLRTFSIGGPIPELVHGLERFRPHYLHGYPTYLEQLAHERLLGRLGIDPEFISLGSEPVTESARAVLRKAFPNAEISETYGATECLAIANQCRFGSLHVNEDFCVLEPVDAAGVPVPAGVPSAKVLVTNLVNRAQPLLRYELTDSVTIVAEPCACGTPLARIQVEGRSDDTFYLQDREGLFAAHTPVPFEVLFLDVDGLAQYQLVHDTQNRLVARYVTAPGGDPSAIRGVLEGRFRGYLARHGLDGVVAVDIVAVERLERSDKGHKLRQIYSRVQRPGVPARDIVPS
jgi:phenylacetate-coenzyme A ligase PaaK-like adenylate-forming protein